MSVNNQSSTTHEEWCRHCKTTFENGIDCILQVLANISDEELEAIAEDAIRSAKRKLIAFMILSIVALVGAITALVMALS